MARRRRVLKSAGAIAALGITGLASGEKSDEKIPAKEVGIENAVKKQLEKGKIKQARRLLDNHDITYDITQNNKVKLEGEGDDVGAQSYYSGSSSDVYYTLVHMEDDIWLATGITHLRDRNYSLRDGAMVDDAFALTWDNSEWTSPDRTQNNLTLYSSNQAHSTRYEEYNHYGVAGALEYDWNSYPEVDISMSTELIRRNDHPDIGVKFEHKHTFALTNEYISGIGIDVGSTGLSIDLDFESSEVWNQEASADP